MKTRVTSYSKYRNKSLDTERKLNSYYVEAKIKLVMRGIKKMNIT